MLRRRTLLAGTTAAMAALTAGRLGTRSGPLPAAAQQGMMPMGNLADLSGADFEHRFIHQMVVHHAMAVVMTRPVARRAIHAELRTMAEAIVNDQAREISMMLPGGASRSDSGMTASGTGLPAIGRNIMS